MKWIDAIEFERTSVSAELRCNTEVFDWQMLHKFNNTVSEQSLCKKS